MTSLPLNKQVLHPKDHAQDNLQDWFKGVGSGSSGTSFVGSNSSCHMFQPSDHPPEVFMDARLDTSR